MTAPKQRTTRWTGAEQLRVALVAEGLADEALGALLRQDDLHAAQLVEWRAAVEATLGTPAPRRPSGPSPEAQREVPAHHAMGPEQVWSRDITYLQSPVWGLFRYLYVIMDIWSRRIMSWAVYPTQSDAHAATLFTTVYQIARTQHPERWRGNTRDWSRPTTFVLERYTVRDRPSHRGKERHATPIFTPTRG
jgi:transposase InsO family protein